jgi:hypothetical protein
VEEDFKYASYKGLDPTKAEIMAFLRQTAELNITHPDFCKENLHGLESQIAFNKKARVLDSYIQNEWREFSLKDTKLLIAFYVTNLE